MSGERGASDSHPVTADPAGITLGGVPSTLIGLRLPPELMTRLSAIIEQQQGLATLGKVATAAVARKCLELGLPLLEEQLGIKPPAEKPAKRKR